MSRTRTVSGRPFLNKKECSKYENGDVLAISCSYRPEFLAVFISASSGGISVNSTTTEDPERTTFLNFTEIVKVELVAKYGSLAQKIVYNLMEDYQALKRWQENFRKGVRELGKL